MRALVVDGYNLVYAHPQLAAVVGRDRDAAREGLLKELMPLAVPDHYHLVMVVFDAAGSNQAQPRVEDRGAMKVVFTRRGQSADSFIEIAVRHLVPGDQVEVATNDRTLVAMVTGFGARVIDGTSLLEMARQAQLETREEARRMSWGGRSPLEDRIGEEVRRLLDEMRYQ